MTALLALPATAQVARRAVSAEIGGASASATANFEQPLGYGLTARVGLGTMPLLGVSIAAPLGVRFAADAGPVVVEVGAGALLASLSSEYIFAWVTDVEPSPSLQTFPTVEGSVRFGVGGGRFARVGLGALYDRYDPATRVKVLPSVGLGFGL